jgi:hypothetical protein
MLFFFFYYYARFVLALLESWSPCFCHPSVSEYIQIEGVVNEATNFLY